MTHFEFPLDSLQNSIFLNVLILFSAFGEEDEGGVQVPRRLRVMRAQDMLEVDSKLQRGEKKLRIISQIIPIPVPKNSKINIAKMYFS